MQSKFSFSIYSLFLVPFFLIPNFLQAQQDSLSIQQKIMESKESDQMIIMRTRNFIYNKLKTGNITDVANAFNYALRNYESEKVKPFWLDEKFLLSYWVGDYNLVYKADSLDNDFKSQVDYWGYPNRDILFPQKDELTVELGIMTNKNKTNLAENVDSLVSDNEKHDFLILFLDWLTFSATDSEMTYQEQRDYLVNDLTPRAEKFLETYKDSQFAPFVRKYFRYVYVLNNFGYGLQIGLGALMPQGEASNYLNTEYTLVMDFNLNWKRALFDFGVDMGVPRTLKKPFEYEGKFWNTDIKHNYYAFYLSAGYVAKETDFIKIIPHLGIGGINVSVCEEDKDKAGDDFSMTQAIVQYGITCDLKLGGSYFTFEPSTYSYSGISFSLNYNQFLGSNPVMTGGMLQLRITYTLFTREIVREM